MDKFNFRNNNFDLIRFFAALQVVFMHGTKHFDVDIGDGLFIHLISLLPGVPIFFVISGFLISASFERNSSLKIYFLNRFLRIYPALWVSFLFSLITVFVFYNPVFTLLEFISWIFAQISIGQFYNPGFLRDYGVGVLNGSLWTIPVELQFYLVLPILYWVFNKLKWNKIFLFILLIIFILINFVYLSFKDTENIVIKLFGVSVLPYLYMFIFGVLLQRYIQVVKKILCNNFFLVFVVYIAVTYLLSRLGFVVSGNYLNPISALFLALLTISFAYSYTGLFKNILRGNDISYGIYIYHMIIVNVLVHNSFTTPKFNLILMILITLIVSYISWKYIEKPALSLKNHSINNKFFN